MRNIIVGTLLMVANLAVASESKPQLLRQDYISTTTELKRQYFVYLPDGYKEGDEKKWPLMLFLHGNGERGNGLSELGHVLKHGPLYEAWIQKRNLPFIIVAPQLPMFDFDKRGIGYIDNRTNDSIPKRLANGTPPRPEPFSSNEQMNGVNQADMTNVPPLFPLGWEQVEHDVMTILADVKSTFNVEQKKVYLTGLSYGGVGTWYFASKHPKEFAAIAPVVGWGHPSLMAPIAKHQLPIWQFAGGRDSAVQLQYFYQGVNEIERLGHKIRFTIHADMEHDTWTRVYSGQDLYQWLLTYEK